LGVVWSTVLWMPFLLSKCQTVLQFQEKLILGWEFTIPKWDIPWYVNPFTVHAEYIRRALNVPEPCMPSILGIHHTRCLAAHYGRYSLTVHPEYIRRCCCCTGIVRGVIGHGCSINCPITPHPNKPSCNEVKLVREQPNFRRRSRNSPTVGGVPATLVMCIIIVHCFSYSLLVPQTVCSLEHVRVSRIVVLITSYSKSTAYA